MKFTREAEMASRTQSYQAGRQIEGVKVVEIKRFVGEDGSFSEIVRFDEEGKVSVPQELAGFAVRQVNHTKVESGTVKAWHLHRRQDEIWFIHPEGKLIIGLLDVREDGATLGESMRLSLGDGKAHLVHIPRGVAHGLSNPYPKEATMTYLVNNHFTGEDEYRLPSDFALNDDFHDEIGPDFWQIRKG